MFSSEPRMCREWIERASLCSIIMSQYRRTIDDGSRCMKEKETLNLISDGEKNIVDGRRADVRAS